MKCKRPLISSRNTALMLLQLPIIILLCKYNYSPPDLSGTWKGTYNKKPVFVSFRKDSSCTFEYYDIVSDTLNIINGKYSLDFTKKHIPLSIYDIDQISHSLYTIIDLVGSDSLRIATFSPKWRLRPISFNNDMILNLKKMPQINN